MAFADWDFFTGPDFSASLDVSTPINGSGSLAMGKPGVNAATDYVHGHLDSGFTRGYTKGRIRTLIRYDWATDGSNQYGNTGAFIYFMCNNIDPATTTSAFYLLGFVRTRLGLNNLPNRFVLARLPNDTFSTISIDDAGDLDIFLQNAEITLGNGTGTTGTTIPIQVDWNYDPVNLGGLRITASHGDIGDTDYTNLAVQFDIVDPNPVTTSPLREGIAFIWNASHLLLTSEFMTFEDTDVYTLA